MTIELFPNVLHDAKTTLLRMVERVEDDDVVFIILIKENETFCLHQVRTAAATFTRRRQYSKPMPQRRQ